MSYCVLCRKYKTPGNNEISYFGFPKDRLTRLKWINFCKLKLQYEEVPVTYKICSLHFNETNFIDNRKGGGLRILKRGSIPSVKAILLESRGNLNLNSCPNLINHSDEISSCSSTNSQNSSLSLSNASSYVTESSYEGTIVCTPIKRALLATPRYVGDIDDDHTSTPRRAKRCLQLCKTVIKQKKLQIQNLQKHNRRLVKKIRNLKEFLYSLKERHLSTTAVDNIMANIPDALNYIIKRCGKQQAVELFKDFSYSKYKKNEEESEGMTYLNNDVQNYIRKCIECCFNKILCSIDYLFIICVE
ncbi:hypothetical protein RN001_006976 [Aquatica leii]|uniref:THAP-type domain-containing protein n=1 Tax=Aquatica leii TaxID=1421715 RepID=A0AAN7Q6K8_9COLE|nr:hypothetical protein RN001_006976 [Aquatica leii]